MFVHIPDSTVRRVYLLQLVEKERILEGAIADIQHVLATALPNTDLKFYLEHEQALTQQLEKLRTQIAAYRDYIGVHPEAKKD